MLLEISNLTAGYGDTTILHDLSLKIAEGEIVALIGHNGAGKTTTLLSIIGEVQPRQGKVFFQGKDLKGQIPSQICQRGIAYVAQGENVFRTLTVDENLQMGSYMGRDRLGVKEEQQRREFVFDLFPILAEKRQQRAGSLSGGQRQMLALGTAIVSKPSALLLDEPSTGLAPVLVDKVLSSVKEISKGFKTAVLIVEQNVGTVLRFADQVCVMKLGSLVYEGKPENITVEGLWKLF